MSVVDSREDTDRLLSYYTKQQVLFLDRKLGITFYFCTLCIAVYIVAYMFVYKKGYLELEQAKGGVVTHVFGDTVAASSGKRATRYFSAEDLTYPGLENGNVFVATRQRVHRQKRGVCEDHEVPCTIDNHCTEWGKGYCSPNGYCVEPSWCSQGSDEAEVYELNTGSLQIWARSTIQFVKIAPERVFTEDHKPGPQRGIDTFTVRELLIKCEPLPVRYEEVSELGAVIEVQFFWDCNVKAKECHPDVRARRLDVIFDPDNIGFGFSYPEYISKHERLFNEMRGIRIFFRTAGVGKKVSVSASIEKGSLGAALFAVAQIIADLLLTRVFALKKKYQARKYETTKDFSDYMKEIVARKAEEVPASQIEAGEKEALEKELHWMQHLDESDD